MILHPSLASADPLWLGSIINKLAIRILGHYIWTLKMAILSTILLLVLSW